MIRVLVRTFGVRASVIVVSDFLPAIITPALSPSSESATWPNAFECMR